MALKKLQIETMELDAVFHRQVYEMEKNFQEKHNKVFQKRLAIVLGTHEPSEGECQLSEQQMGVCEKISQLKLTSADDDVDVKGIPDFWLTVLKYVPKVDVMVKDYDEPILKVRLTVKG